MVPSSSSRPPKRRRKYQNKGDNDEGATHDNTSKDTSPPTSATPVEKLSPVVVFAHGADAPSSSDWMIRWKKMLGKALNTVEVVTFDYPYISGGKRKAPPKAEELVHFHSDIVKNTVAKYPGHPLILAGKSMGSRVSCMVASDEGIEASAVVCLGYPLKGMNGELWDEMLFQLTAPIMFVQGTKDGLYPLERLEAVRKKMKSVNELHVIDGGDHSFKIGKKRLQLEGSTQDEAEDLAVQAIAAFVAKALRGSSVHTKKDEIFFDSRSRNVNIDVMVAIISQLWEDGSQPSIVDMNRLYLEAVSGEIKRYVYDLDSQASIFYPDSFTTSATSRIMSDPSTDESLRQLIREQMGEKCRQLIREQIEEERRQLEEELQQICHKREWIAQQREEVRAIKQRWRDMMRQMQIEMGRHFDG